MDYSSQQKKSFLNRVLVSRFFTGVLVLIIGAYAGFTVQSVALTNERKELREEIRQTQIAISDLEVTYFELAQAIDPTTIEQLGFSETVTPVFAYTEESYPAVALIR